jgi:hypothetical protein
MGRSRHRPGFPRHFWLVVAALVVTSPSAALAGGNDLELRRLGTCTNATIDGREVCVAVAPDEEGFDSLTRDLGLTLSPKRMAPAETLGEAGFEYAFELLFNVVDGGAAYYRALEDRDPGNLLLTSQFHIRKGLPFSFELGGVLSHLFDSNLWAVGAEIMWALHEDYLYPVPDLGVRGFVNNVVGSTDLNLTTAGFDILLDLPIGVNGVVELTPYAGYNFTAVFSSSRLLDASPEDPTPPTEGGASGQSIKPEFVFDNRTNTYSRFVGGMRLRYAVLNATFETSIGANVVSTGLHLGLDF